MTTNVQARDAIIAEVLSLWSASSFSSVPFHWQGGPVPNIDAIEEFAYGAVKFLNATQASIEASPLTRVRGELVVSFFRKEPNGDRRQLEMAEYLGDALKHRNLSGVQLATPTPAVGEARSGWVSSTWSVPFWHHK